jgi:hypothetical protein
VKGRKRNIFAGVGEMWDQSGRGEGDKIRFNLAYPITTRNKRAFL